MDGVPAVDTVGKGTTVTVADFVLLHVPLLAVTVYTEVDVGLNAAAAVRILPGAQV
jgi:hypothetical protein